MKKLFLLMMSIAFVSVTMQAQTNLVPNGDMALWATTDTTTTGYAILPTGYAEGPNLAQTHVSIAPGAFTGGKNAIRVHFSSSSGSSSRSFATPYTTSSLVAGEYTLTFWVKGNGWIRGLGLITDAGAIGTANNTPPSSYTQRPWGGSGNNKSTKDHPEWTKYEQTYIIEAGTYRVSFGVNNGGTSSKPDTLCIADISLVKSGIASDDNTLKSLSLTETTFTNGASGKKERVPGFIPNKTNYLVELSFNYPGEIPIVSAETNYVLASTVITQATSLTGTEAERTATIVVEAENGDKKNYTVTFEKTKDFIYGFHWDIKTSAYWSFISTSCYTKDDNANGLYWGNSSIRPTSGNGMELITPALENGAGILSFNLKQYSTNLGSEMLIQYRMDEASAWVRLDSIESSALPVAWTPKSYTINEYGADKDLPGTVQVRFKHIKETGAAAVDFMIDDIRVTAYTPTSDKSFSPSANSFSAYPQANAIVIEQSGEAVYQIYNVNGQLIASGIFSEKVSIPVQAKGLYIVKVGEKARKVVVK